jgi:hypothetical protein
MDIRHDIAAFLDKERELRVIVNGGFGGKTQCVSETGDMFQR